MKIINQVKKIAIATLLLSGLAGCQEERTIPTKPETVIVSRTVPPFEGAIWIDTEYKWNGQTYIIVPAHWTKPVASGLWVHGYWKSSKKGYSWVPGHWK